MSNITFSSKAASLCPYLSIPYLFRSKTWTTKSRWRPPEKLKARFIGHRKTQPTTTTTTTQSQLYWIYYIITTNNMGDNSKDDFLQLIKRFGAFLTVKISNLFHTLVLPLSLSQSPVLTSLICELSNEKL